jgi:hypothetical protein
MNQGDLGGDLPDRTQGKLLLPDGEVYGSNSPMRFPEFTATIAPSFSDAILPDIKKRMAPVLSSAAPDDATVE